MKIDIEPNNWGTAVQNKDILAVLRSAAGQIVRHCKPLPIPDIRVKPITGEPVTPYRHDPDGAVVVGLTAREKFWAQYAHQFAHEFAHVLAGHTGDKNRIWHYKHANSWFEEALCETASMFVLRGMSRKWRHNPPYDNWKEFSTKLYDYANELMTRPVRQLMPGTAFVDWFSQNERSLRLDCEQRDKNAIIARHLLPFFEKQPQIWETLTHLNYGTRDVDLPFKVYFCEWKASSAHKYHRDLDEVAKLFGIVP